MNKNNTKNMESNPTKKRLWSQEENEQLLKAVKNNKTNAPLSQVFNEFAAQHNRPVGSVTQHYYHMTKDSSNAATMQVDKNVSNTKSVNKNTKTAQNNNDVTVMVKKIKKMPARAISSLAYIVNNMNV